MFSSGDQRRPLPALKWYKTLTTKKGRLEAEAFLVEGMKAITHIMTQHPAAILELLSVDASVPEARSYPVRRLTPSQLKAVCSTKTPQGMAAVVRLPTATYAMGLPRRLGTHIILLEDIQDPGNVGTLIRTAVAFGFSGVILTEKCADPFAPKCVQATAGTVCDVWIRKTSEPLTLVGTLQKRGYTYVATDLHGADELSRLQSQEKLLLALGNEAAGLSQPLLQKADYRLRISLNPHVDSLNVAVCGAICMYMSFQRAMHDA